MRLFITAKPSASPVVERFNRKDLRRMYRRLRTVGIVRWEARHIVSCLIAAGTQEVRP
jgi:hypothetical protein